jgi:hypothetical protein
MSEKTIKPKSKLKYKQKHSFKEHYNKEFNKVFNNPIPAKATKNPKLNAAAETFAKATSPTIAMKAKMNQMENKQYKNNRGNQTETIGKSVNPFKKVSKYYSKGGRVFTGR